jgi:hypothetical protein
MGLRIEVGLFVECGSLLPLLLVSRAAKTRLRTAAASCRTPQRSGNNRSGLCVRTEMLERDKKQSPSSARKTTPGSALWQLWHTAERGKLRMNFRH